jgi:hypothetical protein
VLDRERIPLCNGGMARVGVLPKLFEPFVCNFPKDALVTGAMNDSAGVDSCRRRNLCAEDPLLGMGVIPSCLLVDSGGGTDHSAGGGKSSGSSPKFDFTSSLSNFGLSSYFGGSETYLCGWTRAGRPE